MTLTQIIPVAAWAGTQILKLLAPRIPKRVLPLVGIGVGTAIGLGLSPDAAQLDAIVQAVTLGTAGVGLHELGEGISGKRERRR